MLTHLSASYLSQEKKKKGKLSLCSGSNLYASVRLSAVVHTACTLYREHC